jgi:hypothetical protein
MYDASDPRAQLVQTPKDPSPAEVGAAEYVAFADGAQAGSDQVMRGQNFVLHHATVQAGAALRRKDQLDEYVVLVPDVGTRVTIRAGAEAVEVARPSVVIIPPGDSEVVAQTAGRLVRLLTVVSAPDLVQTSLNRHNYQVPKPNVSSFVAWPDPTNGYAIRVYNLDVPSEPGRFGRIWRCSTFMVNVLDPQHGPRDPHQLSPHTHPDFEQCSLSLQGDFVHHLRWPWGTDRTLWRDDVHIAAPAPSAAVIPPPVVHTTEATGTGLNQLVDIFCPPRLDFSQAPGWVLNEDDYPKP